MIKQAVIENVKEQDFIEAPCLRAGSIAESGRQLVAASRELGSSNWASVLRAWCVPNLFGAMERIFASGEEPTGPLNEALLHLAKFLRAGTTDVFQISENRAAVKSDPTRNLPVEEITGEHYGRLFQNFSADSYWQEPVRLLRERIERNGILLEEIAGKSVIDVGCGGGRYSAAWRLLGAGRVVGYDISNIGLRDARRRVQAAGIGNVSFKQGNVLNLPYADNVFDVVFSNGVLHHTADWEQGVGELVRVLKPNGIGWLYLIENPGGLFWDVIEILRVIMRGEDKATARAALHIIGIPANRIFYMLDHVLVPINVRLTPAQIEDCLKKSGATRIRRLRRGTDFDRVEQITQKRPFAEICYGVGENRFVFSKD
jgi:SAM-dependent methyltransferase